MNVYDIFVNGKKIAENVQHCDLQHKIDIIRGYCELERDLRYAKITYSLNKPETIA